MTRLAKLVLEDGSVWEGEAFGADGEAFGPICVHSCMLGYQEIITDPSSRGQIVLLTYPEIGNVGANSDDVQSDAIQLEALVVSSVSSRVSNFRAETDLKTYLKRFGKLGISGIDTRAIARRISKTGTQNAVVSSVDLDDASLIKKAKDRNQSSNYTSQSAYDWDEPLSDWLRYATKPDRKTVHGVYECQCDSPNAEKSPLVVLVDFGTKWDFARALFDMGCRVKIVPGASISADSVLMYNPNGIFLSSGPWMPDFTEQQLNSVRELVGKCPIFAVGYGTILLAAAFGGKAETLKNGHHGYNNSVICHETRHASVTSQNRLYGIDRENLPACFEVTHSNLHDNSVEGIRHKEHPAFGVLFYPDYSALPEKSESLFSVFGRHLRCDG